MGGLTEVPMCATRKIATAEQLCSIRTHRKRHGSVTPQVGLGESYPIVAIDGELHVRYGLNDDGFYLGAPWRSFVLGPFESVEAAIAYGRLAGWAK